MNSYHLYLAEGSLAVSELEMRAEKQLCDLWELHVIIFLHKNVSFLLINLILYL